MTNAEMFQDVFGRFPYLPCEDGYYIDAKLQDRQWWDMLFRRDISIVGGRDMSNEEIFAQIGKDVSDIYNSCFGSRDITIWMTKKLFNKLCQGQFVLQKDSAMITLFGCRIKVVVLPCDGMQWIVGYEGKAEEE